MSLPRPTVDIIMVNFSNPGDTLESLDAVLTLGYGQFRVIVVDNASTDDSWPRFVAWSAASSRPADFITAAAAETYQGDAKVLFIRADANRGFAAGNNIAIRLGMRQNTDFFWLLNNDTEVEPGALDELLNFMARNSGRRIGIVGGKLRFYHRRNILQGVWGTFNPLLGIAGAMGEGEEDHGQYDQRQPELRTDYVIGASMFVDGKFLRDVGLLNEDYFLYFEELDWCLRGVALGWRIGYCPECIVYHKFGGSIGSTPLLAQRNATADFYSIRNRLRITVKHFPWYLPLVMGGLLGTFLRRLAAGRFHLAFVVMPRAVIHGLSGGSAKTGF